MLNILLSDSSQPQTAETKPLTPDSDQSQSNTPEIQSVMAEPQTIATGYVIVIIVAAALVALIMVAIILCFGK